MNCQQVADRGGWMLTHATFGGDTQEAFLAEYTARGVDPLLSSRYAVFTVDKSEI
jgi:hypothetical protein